MIGVTSPTQAQVQFAAEFISLVVAASAFFLVLLAPRRAARARTWVSQAGLAAVAVATFLHGSLLATGESVRWVGLARLVGAALVAGTVALPRSPRALSSWLRARTGAVMLRLGLLLWAGAGLAELLSPSPSYLVDGFLFAGSALAFASPLFVAQRSVYVRVATSSAVAMLIVVVILALALSTVISSSVRSDQLARLDDRVGVEKSQLADTQPIALAAQLVEADLAGALGGGASNPFVELASGTPAQRSAARDRIAKQLSTVDEVTAVGDLAFRSAGGEVVAVGPRSGSVSAWAQRFSLPGSCTAGVQGLFSLGGTDGAGGVGGGLVQAATSPECTATGRQLGSVVVARLVDDAYLQSRLQVDPTVSLALVSGGAAVAAAGIPPSTAVSLDGHLSDRVAAAGSAGEEIGSHYASVAELTAAGTGGNTRVDLVAIASTASVAASRDRLFRTLFLIAFGGTVLALGLAVYASDRITGGVRRLTRVAAAIQAGEVSVRAGIEGRDEVATLGAAFDSMVDSVTATSAALQAVVEDETRLRNRLEAVVAGMTDALIAVDPDGTITDFNRAAEDLTGVPAARAVGDAASAVVDVRGEDGEPIGESLFAAGGDEVRMVAQVVRRGQRIPVAIATGAVQGAAGVVQGAAGAAPDGPPVVLGQVLVLRDLRHEIEVETMKTEFLSRVGHELRTPLTGIIGYAEIMSRRSVGEERSRAWSDEILGSARRLARIIEMLEFFATDGAGRAVMRLEPVDAGDLVGSIVAGWTDRLPANVSIGRRLGREKAVLIADRRWLSMAIDELVDNAVKFSPDGGRIGVSVRRDGERVEVSVSDHGVGITPEQYEVALGDFTQVDASDTRRYGGLGLGLAVVARVVERHGGTMACKSVPGKGTTFSLRLPVGGAE